MLVVRRRARSAMALGLFVLGSSALLLAARAGEARGAPPVLSVTIPSPYSAAINPGNLPADETYKGGTGCNEFPTKSADQAGWLFVASPSDFVQFIAIFDNGAHTVTLTSQADVNSTKYFAKSFDHLAIVTPDDWTLTGAFAVLNPATDNDFVLSHTCAGTDSVESESPSPSPSVSESVSPSPSESPSPSPSVSESVSPSPSVSESVSPSPSVSESVSPSPSVSESVSPSPSVSESVSPSPSITVNESPSVAPSEEESVSPTPSEEIESPSVSPTEFETSPAVSPSAKVGGVKVVKPVVRPRELAGTGAAAPVALLVIVGFACLGLGLVLTVRPLAADGHPAGGRHRRTAG